jgi:transcriptional regulator GlxA family with amidase domain
MDPCGGWRGHSARRNRALRAGSNAGLVGGADTPWQPGAHELASLRGAMRGAARVCIFGGAVFVPLAAGMLAGKRVAVSAGFRAGVEEGPGAPEIVSASTCHHKALSSAAGPVAAIRLMADMVGARDGAYTREALARELGLSEPHETAETGEYWRCTRLAAGDEALCEALKIMRDHLEDTLTVGQIAELLDVSPRKLERGFADALGQTPLKVYRDPAVGARAPASYANHHARERGFGGVWFFQRDAYEEVVLPEIRRSAL